MEQLTFQEFVTELADYVKQRLEVESNPPKVEIKEVPKVGDQIQTALTIVEPGSHMSKLFYLDDMYPSYTAGMPLDFIKENLFACIRKEGTTVPFDGLDMQWEKVKDKVVMRLINLERNNLYVADRIYRPLEGTSLGLIYDIDVGCTNAGTAFLRVTKEVQKELGVSEEDLCAAAYANTQRLAPAMICPLADIIRKLQPELDVPEEEDTRIAIVTNQAMLNGAVAVLYPETEEKLRDLLSGDFYLIPSSVHEMLAVRCRDMEPGELEDLIGEVNASVVQAGDILDAIPYQLRNGRLYPALVHAKA